LVCRRPAETVSLQRRQICYRWGTPAYWSFVPRSCSGINHMRILKNSKDLLDNLKSRSFSQVSSIKTFDFSTLYTTLPHDKLKTWIDNSFVEQVDDPAMYLSLHGVLWSLGIQYK
jgi:hypothetical protein